MKIVICDDLENELELTTKLCKEYLAGKKIQGEVHSLTHWEDYQGELPDLVILDIEMPEKSGIDIKEELSGGERPLILFVTSYEDYMSRAFGKNVMGFMQKPLEQRNFAWYMDRVIKQLTAGKIISLEDGSRISTEKIKMITVDNRYTEVLFSDGTSSSLQIKSLSVWEKELEDVYFLRISQSTLVNSKFAIDFVEDILTMEDGEKLKVSRRKKKDCYMRFMEYNRKYAKAR